MDECFGLGPGDIAVFMAGCVGGWMGVCVSVHACSFVSYEDGDIEMDIIL